MVGYSFWVLMVLVGGSFGHAKTVLGIVCVDDGILVHEGGPFLQ